MPFIQTDTYTVRGYETDATNKLSVPTLMNWMQESANRNALDYGIGIADLFKHGLGWMLMRFRLTLNRYPVYGDTVRVVTFPTHIEKYFIYRDFRLLSETGEVLAQAASTWITFSTERRTMVTLPDFIRQLQPPLVDNPLPPLPLKPGFTLPELLPQTTTRTIGWFDLDANQHTNNVSYVQALIESMPEAHLRMSQLTDLDLFFKAESHLHEPLRVQTWLDADTGLHRIVHADDAREVLLARSIWEKNLLFTG